MTSTGAAIIVVMRFIADSPLLTEPSGWTPLERAQYPLVILTCQAQSESTWREYAPPCPKL